ncbi:aminoglycoside phosphotransferase family protein [Elioraea rosea]|uniref:aminoglycoside phosphotransferase family protein n=1 Tax=Elioraea rosea TaxID=2492390 RepID=UPI001EF5BE62|nr:phosphotransferase [Elioraea rosea]
MTVEDFLARHGFADAARHALPGDASFRRYERLEGGPRPALLMVCPPGKETVGPFVRVAQHLRSLGLSAPSIIGADDAAGLAIVEDLGTDTFTALLAGGEDEAALYGLAVDALAVLHQAPPPAWAPAWGPAQMTAAAKATLLDWWWPAMFGGEPRAAVIASFEEACTAMLAPFAADAPVLALRDFHVDNLLRLPGRVGAAACGLLDFQDAGIGHRAYDLASLLEDARRDVPAWLAESMRARYLAHACGLDAARFDAAFAAHAAMRHARVAALWTRLERRDGKPHYLAHAPRTWRLLAETLAHPSCAPLAAWFDAHVPPALRRAPEARAA